jgi:pimeloyl-ACP methyl ester carboxylesterase
MYYEEAGKGMPVLGLHGFGLDHRSILHALEPTFEGRSGWHRLYPDLPASGSTKLDSCATSADAYLDAIEAFIDETIPGQAFAVAGHSYGAYLARGLLARRLSSLTGLALIAPVVIPDKAVRHVGTFEVAEADEEAIGTLDEGDRDGARNALVVQNARNVDRYQKEILDAIPMANQSLLGTMYNNAYSFSFPIDDVLFSGPALIVTGKQDDVVGYSDAYSLLDCYPKASYVVLDGAGHTLEIDQEQLVSTLIGDWIDRVAANNRGTII